MVRRRFDRHLVGGVRARWGRGVLRYRLGVWLVLGLWVVITAAAAGPRAEASHWFGLPSLGGPLTFVALALVAIGVVVVVLALVSRPKQEVEAPERRPVWLQLLVLGAFILLSRFLPRLSEDDLATTEPELAEAARATPEGDRLGPVVTGDDLAMVLAVAAISFAVFVWTRHRGQPSLDEPVAAGADIVGSIEPMVARAARHLAVGDDPRLAVMAAYASVEDALAGIGLARAPSETSTEYLRRVLGQVPVDSTPLITLARLHELARYSTHAVTVDDQRAAARALERARHNLHVVSA